jgi:hypothetical protein
MFDCAKAYGRIARRGALPAVIAVAAAFLSPLCAQESFLRLPPDEGGLVELLEERAIDSLQYEQLLAFYALPLSVPQGELGYLVLAFPDIADMLPATYEELSAYEPFDNRQIRRLFSDYPALGGFEPILRFNVAERRSGGEVTVGVNRSRASALTGHRVRFRRAGKLLSADGGVTLSDSAALWQSRRAAASYGGINAQVGNFKRNVPVDLTLGEFSSLAELTDGKMSGVAENWLYGGSDTWNGASVDIREIPGAEAVGASAFCHLRPNETGWGAGAGVRVGKRAAFGAYLAGFNDYSFAHVYAEYKASGLRAEAVAAAPLAGKSNVPALSLRLNHRVKGASAEYGLVSYPKNFDAPHSRLKKRLLAEIGEKDPSEPVRKHSLRTAVPFADGAVKLIPELDFTASGGVRRIRGQAQVLARAGAANVSVKHASKFLATGVGAAPHSSCAAVGYQTRYPLEFRAAFQSAYGGGKKPRSAYSLEAPVAALPNAAVTPYVRGKHAAAGEYWLGIKSEFHLYKKTWTGVTVEIPVNVKREEGVYVKAASSYSF